MDNEKMGKIGVSVFNGHCPSVCVLGPVLGDPV